MKIMKINKELWILVRKEDPEGKSSGLATIQGEENTTGNIRGVYIRERRIVYVPFF